VRVNGKRADVPSFSLKAGDAVTVRERSSKKPSIVYAMEEVKGRGIPGWLEFDASTMTGRVATLPTRDEINLPVQEQLIVELYSK
jgi:small subunit ribosomal protein S4